jgi:hypothetical protein
MLNYSDILKNANYNKTYSSKDVHDWNTFIFDNPEDKPNEELLNQFIHYVSNILPIKEKQKEIQRLLLESDYIELSSFLERKGQETYNLWMTYRTNLREAYHDFELPIPEKPL